MKTTKNKRKALNAAFQYMCRTGDWKPYVKAFRALYGKDPVYLPQH